MATVQRYGSGYSVRYWYETETGEKKQKRVSGFRSKEEAWAAAKELKEKSDAGINVNGSAMTCAELMELWFKDRCVGLAVTTKAKYSASIEVLSKTFIADLKIRQLTHQRYHLLLDKLQEKPVHLRTAVCYTEPLLGCGGTAYSLESAYEPPHTKDPEEEAKNPYRCRCRRSGCGCLLA